MPERTSLTVGIRIAFAGAIALPVLLVLIIAIRAPIADGETDGRSKSDGPDDSSDPSDTDRTSPHRDNVPSAHPSSVAPVPIRSAAPVALSSAARESNDAFTHALQMNDLKGALTNLKHLLEIDADAARDDATRDAIVDLTMRIMLVVGPEPDAMFDLLINHMGTTGIDILYQLVTTKGGSKAATFAEKFLERDDVRARGTDALRAAYSLRAAKSCDDKRALFPTVAANGDGRTLGQLYLLNRRCGRRHSEATCCLNGDKDLTAAIDMLQKRGAH